MGLLMGALAGAAGAVEDTTKYALRSMMDEEKANRIAEYSSRLKSNEDLTTRGRNKADAAEERGRVQTEAQAAADKRGGLLSQSATDAYNALASTDPEGAQAGLDAVNQAKAEGRYKQEPTTKDMLLAQGDIKTIAAMDEKSAANEIKTQIAQGKLENAIQIANIKGDFSVLLGEMKGEIARNKNNGQDKVIAHQFMSSMDRDITHNQDTIKQLRSQMAKDLSIDPDEKKEITSRISDLEAANSRITTAKRDFAMSQGIQIPDILNQPAKTTKTVKFGDLTK